MAQAGTFQLVNLRTVRTHLGDLTADKYTFSDWVMGAQAGNLIPAPPIVPQDFLVVTEPRFPIDEFGEMLVNTLIGSLNDTDAPDPGLANWVGTWLFNRFPETVRGVGAAGAVLVPTRAKRPMLDYIAANGPIPDPTWASRRAANAAAIATANAHNADVRNAATPMVVPPELFSNQDAIDYYNAQVAAGAPAGAGPPAGDTGAPMITPDFCGVPLSPITRMMSLRQIDVFMGLVIWGSRHTPDQHNRLQFSTYRPAALRRHLGIDESEAGPIGADFPDEAFFTGLGRLGMATSPRFGLMISRVSMWWRTQITEDVQDFWIQAQYLAWSGMNGIIAITRLAEFHPDLVRQSHILASEIALVADVIKAYKEMSQRDRAWQKAIHGASMAPLSGARVSALRGAGRMIVAAHSAHADLSGDFNFRPDQQILVRNHLLMHGTRANGAARPTT
jgi:hypothetical protein